jgi:hypothetical protein
LEEVHLFAIADGGVPAGELAAVGVEGNWALGVIIFKSFRLGEAEGNLGRRAVRQMLLDKFVRNYGDFAHFIKFIMKKNKYYF